VYWLAQVYHQSGQFDRAADLLKKKKTWSESVACRFLAAQCAVSGATHIATANIFWKTHLPCYFVKQIELENWKDALDLLGHDNPFANKGILLHHSFILLLSVTKSNDLLP
jgi:hypothetical protein